MHRSIGFEHPDQTFRHLDLATGDLDDGDRRRGGRALLTDAGEAARRAAPCRSCTGATLSRSAAVAPAWPLDSGLLDDVVITGGSGAVGLHYARYFAERGARRIVLLGRRRSGRRLLASVAGRTGAEVMAPPCDITDRDRVAATAAEYGGTGASLVIHAAGAAAFAHP